MSHNVHVMHNFFLSSFSYLLSAPEIDILFHLFLAIEETISEESNWVNCKGMQLACVSQHHSISAGALPERRDIFKPYYFVSFPQYLCEIIASF